MLILTWQLGYPQKQGANKKRGESFGSCSVWEGDEWPILTKKEFAWAPGVGEN